MRYLVYKVANGRILGEFHGDELPDSYSIDPGLGAMEITGAESRETHYLAGNPLALAIRPLMPVVINKTTITANGTDAVIVAGIPEGTSVVVSDVNGQHRYEATDGTFEVTADDPQRIVVSLNLWPYQNMVIEISSV
jgi:hypothetical protein